METSASATISTEQKLRNLETSLQALYRELRKEGRYVAASHVNVATDSVAYAVGAYQMQIPGHD